MTLGFSQSFHFRILHFYTSTHSNQEKLFYTFLHGTDIMHNMTTILQNVLQYDFYLIHNVKHLLLTIPLPQNDSKFPNIFIKH